MATPELVRSVSPDLDEVPRIRRVALSRQQLSVGDSTNDERARVLLSSSMPPSITKEELNHLKNIQRLEKSKKWLQESQISSCPRFISNGKQVAKSKARLFRRVESVDESIQRRRGFLSCSMSPVGNKAIDDFGMEKMCKMEIDIFDPEESGPNTLRPRSASLHATTSTLSPSFKKRSILPKSRPVSARSGGRSRGKCDIQEQEAITQKVDNTFAKIKSQLAMFLEEDALLQHRLDKLSEEITEVYNAQKKVHSVQLTSRKSSMGLRKATQSTSSLELVAELDLPQKAHSSETTPNAKIAGRSTIPTLTVSYSNSSEVDTICESDCAIKGEELEVLTAENTRLPIIELNTSSRAKNGKRQSLGSSGSDISSFVVNEQESHEQDQLQNSSASSLAEDIDDVFVVET